MKVYLSCSRQSQLRMDAVHAVRNDGHAVYDPYELLNAGNEPHSEDAMSSASRMRDELKLNVTLHWLGADMVALSAADALLFVSPGTRTDLLEAIVASAIGKVVFVIQKDISQSSLLGKGTNRHEVSDIPSLLKGLALHEAQSMSANHVSTEGELPS